MMEIKKDAEQACLNLLRTSQYFGHLTLKEVWNRVLEEGEKCNCTLEEALKEI